MEIALSLGSNQGDRAHNLEEAARRIGAIPGARVVARALVYETEPVDVAPQHAQLQFLNTVIVIETEFDPHELLQRLQAIEKAMGRKRGADRNLPRPIDIDIIYAGEFTCSDHDLKIPHPAWASRRFVVQPLCDVRPDARVPGQTRTVREVLSALPETPGVWEFGSA